MLCNIRLPNILQNCPTVLEVWLCVHLLILFLNSPLNGRILHTDKTVTPITIMVLEVVV
ncbi:hypothetical protein AsAng_0039060 [Aureispira anguillae]|uniref:Uncharacterized protein n=1 Tax=Aureispira anguillae TaxID=2864201 RepID=A0A915YHI5_9BACT|nr:hypothetical protein AsAng_0039060 [Aureispira anguillae]